MITSRTN